MECLNDKQSKRNEPNDSYILKEDKLNLIRTMPWADDVLLRVLVKEHYKNVINNMNEEDYKNELKVNDINNLIDYVE